MSIIRIQSFLLLVISYFVIPQSKKLAKDGCVITFLDNFFLDVIHEKHKFKYFKNLTVKQFVKYGAMMSICLFFSVTFFGGN